MTLRVKIVLALLLNVVITVGIIGYVAYDRMMDRFNGMALARSERSFRGDVAAYWLTYGSWENGQKAETLHHFIVRRGALAAAAPQNKDPAVASRPGLPAARPYLGDSNEAVALAPWTAPPGGQGPPIAGDGRVAAPDNVPKDGPHGSAPFVFMLFDPEGHILNPPEEAGRVVRPEEKRDAIPIEVKGETVAYAVPRGKPNFSPADAHYVTIMLQSLLIGISIASAIATAFGLFVGNRLGRALATLTAAVQNMSDGRLAQSVEVKSNDEIGVLARAFNDMSREIAESHRTIAEQAERLRDLATRDGLTKLFNRRHFDEIAGQFHALSTRTKRPFAVALGDVDHFKKINDTFSHAVGDAVLRQIAILLQETIRRQDLTARYGGEEFVFAFPETDLPSAIDCCERLRRTVQDYDWESVQPGLRVTMSIGLSDETASGSLEKMVAEADRRLYRAKSQGRNQVCHASPALAAA